MLTAGPHPSDGSTKLVERLKPHETSCKEPLQQSSAKDLARIVAHAITCMSSAGGAATALCSTYIVTTRHATIRGSEILSHLGSTTPSNNRLCRRC